MRFLLLCLLCAFAQAQSLSRMGQWQAKPYQELIGHGDVIYAAGASGSVDVFSFDGTQFCHMKSVFGGFSDHLFNIEISGDILFGVDARQVVAFDISVPEEPTLIYNNFAGFDDFRNIAVGPNDLAMMRFNNVHLKDLSDLNGSTIGTLDLTWNYNWIEISGSTLFAVNPAGTHAYDISDYNAPALLSTTNVTSQGLPIIPQGATTLSGTTLFVAQDNRIDRVDTSNPNNLVNMGQLTTDATNITGITVMGDRLYLQNGNICHVYSYDGNEITLLMKLGVPGDLTTLIHYNDHFVFPTGSHGLVAIPDDLGTAPTLLNQGDFGTRIQDALMEATYAFLATDTEILVVDHTQPGPLTSAATIPVAASDLKKQGDYLYIGTADGLVIYDVSNPLAPSLAHTEALSPGVHRLDVDGDRLGVLQEPVGAETPLRFYNTTQPDAPDLIMAHQLFANNLLDLAISGDQVAYIGEEFGGQMNGATGPVPGFHFVFSNTRGMAHIENDPNSDKFFISGELFGEVYHHRLLVFPHVVTEEVATGKLAYENGRLWGESLTSISRNGTTPVVRKWADLNIPGTIAHNGERALVGGLDDLFLYDLTATPDLEIVDHIILGVASSFVEDATGLWVANRTGLIRLEKQGRELRQVDELVFNGISGFTVRDNIAYIERDEQLEVLDITDPSNPIELGTFAFSLPENIDRLFIDDLLMVRANDGTVQLLDVTDPANPTSVASELAPNYSSALHVPPYLLIQEENSVLSIRSDKDLSLLNTVTNTRTITTGNQRVLVARGNDELLLYDATQLPNLVPLPPISVFELEISGLLMDGDTLYQTDWDNHVSFWDLSDPANPSPNFGFDGFGIIIKGKLDGGMWVYQDGGQPLIAFGECFSDQGILSSYQNWTTGSRSLLDLIEMVNGRCRL